MKVYNSYNFKYRFNEFKQNVKKFNEFYDENIEVFNPVEYIDKLHPESNEKTD